MAQDIADFLKSYPDASRILSAHPVGGADSGDGALER
jgi:hypothetical protein